MLRSFGPAISQVRLHRRTPVVEYAAFAIHEPGWRNW
jgi:hypothetical protein